MKAYRIQLESAVPNMVMVFDHLVYPSIKEAVLDMKGRTIYDFRTSTCLEYPTKLYCYEVPNLEASLTYYKYDPISVEDFSCLLDLIVTYDVKILLVPSTSKDDKLFA